MSILSSFSANENQEVKESLKVPIFINKWKAQLMLKRIMIG